jgi:hypothetical protein
MVKMAVRIDYSMNLQPMLLYQTDNYIYVTTRIDNYSFTTFFARDNIAVD